MAEQVKIKRGKWLLEFSLCQAVFFDICPTQWDMVWPLYQEGNVLPIILIALGCTLLILSPLWILARLNSFPVGWFFRRPAAVAVLIIISLHWIMITYLVVYRLCR